MMAMIHGTRPRHRWDIFFDHDPDCVDSHLNLSECRATGVPIHSKTQRSRQKPGREFQNPQELPQHGGV